MLSFFVGLILGGIFGFVMMAILAINRDSEEKEAHMRELLNQQDSSNSGDEEV